MALEIIVEQEEAIEDSEKTKYDNLYKTYNWDDVFKEMRSTSPEEDALRRLGVSKYPRHLSTAISIGSGMGHGFRYLKRCGYAVSAVDISSEVGKYYTGDDEKRFFVAPVDSLPFGDDSFDLSVCCDVLEHVPTNRIPKSLSEIRRVTRWRSIIQVFMATTERIAGMHETVKQKEWWLSRFAQIGTVIYAYTESIVLDNGFERLTSVIDINKKKGGIR